MKQGNTMPGYALERAERLLGWESVQALLREAQRPAVATNEPEQLSFRLYICPQATQSEGPTGPVMRQAGHKPGRKKGGVL